MTENTRIYCSRCDGIAVLTVTENKGGPPTEVLECTRCSKLVDDCHCERQSLVDHPPHYTFGGIEVIDAINSWNLGFELGNAVKYIARAKHKGSELQDLKKAVWYIQHEIRKLEVPT